MTRPQLVVLAAGIGSRYGGLKQMDPVGPSGEIIVDYAVYDALQAGFGKIIFVINTAIEDAFRAKVGRAIEARAEVAYAYQSLDVLPAGWSVPPDRSKPWGTAHAMLCAKGAVSGPFAAINADDYYGRSAFGILAGRLSSARDAGGVYDYSMVGYILRNTLTEHGHVARGICTVGNDGFLASVVERTRIKPFDEAVRYTEDGDSWIDIPGDSIASMNMWGFTPSFLDELEARFPAFLQSSVGSSRAEYFVPTVVNELIAEGKARVKVLNTDERWFGVTYRPDMEQARQAVTSKIAAGLYPQKLWA